MRCDNVYNSSSTGLVDKFCGDNVHSSLPSGSVNREQQKDHVKESLPSLIDMVVIIFSFYYVSDIQVML